MNLHTNLDLTLKINEIVGLKDKFIEEGIIMEILRTAYVYAVIIARTFKE